MTHEQLLVVGWQLSVGKESRARRCVKRPFDGRGLLPRAWCLVPVLLCLVAAGCASTRAFKKGQHAERADRYAEAIRHYTEAVVRQPDNPKYRVALSTALMKSGEAHLERGEAFERGGEYELAYRAFSTASEENPLNGRALLKRDLMRKRLLAMAEPEKKPKEAPIVSPLISLGGAPVNLKLSEAELTEILGAIERMSGIGVIYDEGFKSRKVSVNFQQMSFRDVLDRLALAHRLFYKVIDSRTVLVANDSEAKRAEYDEQLVKTFYLQNAEPAKVAGNLKSLMDLKRVMVNADLKAITVRDSAEKLELARRLIEKEDMRRAEVVINIEILEFNRNTLKQYGLDLTGYMVGGAVALDPVTQFPAGSLIRGHMLGNIEASDLLFSIPSVVYRLLRTDTRTRLIARPQLRGAEGETMSVKIGERIPIVVTTFTSVFGGGGVPQQPLTSYQLQEVGLSIELTPTVYHNEEIAAKLKFELTGVIREGTVNMPPTLGNRSLASTIRLKDGETTLICGLIKEEERRSRSGLPGISQVPFLGHLFASNNDQGNSTELAISLTAHIVRMAEVGEEERKPFWVGTEKQLRVSDEPPPFEKVGSSQLAVDSGEERATPPRPPAATELEPGTPSPMVPESAPRAEQMPPVRPPSVPQTAPAVSATEQPPAVTPPSVPDRPPDVPAGDLPTDNGQLATDRRQLATLGFDPLDVVVPVGQEFAMRVTVRSVDGPAGALAGGSFDVLFDQTLLDCVRVEAGRNVGAGFTSNTDAGRVSIQFEAGRSFDGVVCRVVFAAKAPGSTQLQADNAHMTDATGTEFNVSFVPASIRVGGGSGEKTAFMNREAVNGEAK